MTTAAGVCNDPLMDNGNNPPVLGVSGGAQLATQRGEVAIATLRPGDEAAVLGLTGFVRIAATAPLDVALPAVRIGKDAIELNEPRRDSVVAAGTLLVLVQEDGGPLLVRAEALVNAASIARAPNEAAGLWHMTLERSRRSAAGHGELVLLDGLRVATAAAVGVAAATGEQLRAVRTRLRARAQMLGAVPAAHQDVHLLVDGSRIDASDRGDGVWRFDLPGGGGAVMLCSASGVPAEIDVASSDERPLGLGIGRLTFDGKPIELEDGRLEDGWYGLERDGDTAWRWTDGQARLGIAGRGVLEVTIVRVMEIWATPATAQPLPPLPRPVAATAAEAAPADVAPGYVAPAAVSPPSRKRRGG